MTPKAAPSPSAQPLLLLLRLISGFHLLLASLPAASVSHSFLPLFRAAAQVHIPFQLFLAGYLLAHAHSLRPAPLIALRRLLQLWPPYALCAVVHVVLFARRASLSALVGELTALAPFLPPKLAFSPQDACVPAQSLLPSLALCTLVFPVLHGLLPAAKPCNRPQIAFVGACMLAVLVTEAFWLTHLPVDRGVIVPDLAFYVPFLSHVPVFIVGMLLSLWHSAASPLQPRSSFAFLRIVLPLVILLAVTRLLAVDNVYPSIRALSVVALPVPFFVLLVDACFIPSSLQTSANPQAQDSRLQIIRALNRMAYAAFLLAFPLYRAISRSLCAHSNTTFSLICFESHEPPRIYGQQGLFSPLNAGQSPEAAVEQAVVRAFSTSLVFEEGVNIIVYLIVLLLASCLACHIVFVPLASLADAACRRITYLAEEGLLPPLMALMHGHGAHEAPRRDVSKPELFFRLVVYYSFAILFLCVAYRFSQPLANQFVKRPRSFLCWLPDVLYHCQSRVDDDHGIIHFLLTNRYAQAFVALCRFISLLTLPTMSFNLIGHLVFPRAYWKHLPTISQMLDSQAEDANVVDEAAQHIERDQTQGIDNNDSLLKNPVNLDFVLYIRYVTRGTNPRIVATNTRRALQVMYESGLPRHMWCVEVVTDKSMRLVDQVNDLSVHEIIVPADYHPPNGAKYKARALNYAITASTARACDWIVHLDEETLFDVDTVRAIVHHCGVESYYTRVARTQQWPCIGQGPIVYGRAMTEYFTGSGSWVNTLADSNRVSDDCGRYRVQFECGEVWVGMHGSFVVAANCVEQEITFDHGVEGSIAEDAFFAMLARSAKVQFRWVDALMFEQSPFTTQDFIKQRSRWLIGGMRVVNSGQIPLHLRAAMGMLTTLWSMMPVTYIALLVAVTLGGGADETWWKHTYYHIMLPWLGAISLWNYVFGFMVTFSVWAVGLVRYIVLLYAQVVLTPVFGFLEMVSVVYGLLNYEKISTAFHVVQKDGEDGVGERQSLLR